MTTEEKIEEIGTHKPINFISDSDLCAYQQGLKRGAREMASWLEEQMIQKAVKWFIKNTYTRNEGAKHFVVSNGEMIQEVFIENFKQAMKGGGK